MLTHSVDPHTVVSLEKPSLKLRNPEAEDADSPYNI